MKSLRKILAILTIASVAVCLTPHKSSAQVTVSFQLFYDQLSPYGQWVNYPNTGYVWIPNAGAGFTPYSSGGHWVLTEFGWTWVSDYSWGWAPFHYGRWNYESQYGWIWIPGHEWGPAWVSWRKSPGYYGWVPMGYGRDNDKDDQHWVFVRDHDIDRSDISHHYIGHTKNITIIKNSTVIQNSHTDNSRNVTYNAGPDRDEVQKIKGKPIKAVAIQDNDKPGQNMSNGQLKIYRPEVQKENGNQHHPSKVSDIKDVKTQSGKNGGQQQASTPKNKNTRDASPTTPRDNKQPAAPAPNKTKKEKKKPN
ncbi:MAG TPA: DUF6600 domain-containing protein [Chitinophagales bacterium]|nr:DUF6600 domain-containing protein [Chitinophagales bacterium]